MSKTKQVPINRVQSGKAETVDDTLVVEKSVAIGLRGVELIRTTCSPEQMQEWVIGYLFSEGFIRGFDDISEIHEADGLFSVELAGSAPAKPAPLTPVESGLTVEPDRLLEIAREVQRRATIYERTGGTHAMAIASVTDVVSHAEDISRTCALEKALGLALAQRADFSRSFALLSARVPSRMIDKLARCGVPIVAAVSAPTANAIRLAEELDICLCGFVRGERLNVYSHEWRVGL